MAPLFVDGDPYQWPFNGDMTRENTCLIVSHRWLLCDITLL
ncbi:MAG: hypothetical protein ACI90V_011591, partial [Bacillariaceae sp.]